MASRVLWPFVSVQNVVRSFCFERVSGMDQILARVTPGECLLTLRRKLIFSQSEPRLAVLTLKGNPPGWNEAPDPEDHRQNEEDRREHPADDGNPQQATSHHKRAETHEARTDPSRVGVAAFWAGYPIGGFLSGGDGRPAMYAERGFRRNVLTALPAWLQRHFMESLSPVLTVASYTRLAGQDGLEAVQGAKKDCPVCQFRFRCP